MTVQRTIISYEASKPLSCFFEQTVFKGQISDAVFQGQGRRAQIRYLRRCGLPRRIAPFSAM